MSRMSNNGTVAIGHYSAAEVARLAGTTPRRVGSWARYGIIPSISKTPRVYSYADAGEAVLVRYLIENKVPTRNIRKLVEGLRREYGEWPLATAPLKHDGRLIVIERGDDLHFDAADKVDELQQRHRVITGTLLDLKAVREALHHGGWVAVDKPREHIEVNPDRLSGQPAVRGRRVSTEIVADLAKRKQGRELLQTDYELSDEEIREAVEYEADVAKAVA